jgi:hypothetical protein
MDAKVVERGFHERSGLIALPLLVLSIFKLNI